MAATQEPHMNTTATVCLHEEIVDRKNRIVRWANTPVNISESKNGSSLNHEPQGIPLHRPQTNANHVESDDVQVEDVDRDLRARIPLLTGPSAD